MSDMSYKSYRSYKPKKRLGQNFLKNKVYIKKLVDAAGIKKTDIIVEVGAGFGAITVELAKRAKKVIAVEYDRWLVEALERLTVGMKNIEVIHSNILKLDHFNIPTFQHSYKLVGNIPYYLTAPLIRKFLESKNQPELIVFMTQKEMAQRITAKPPNMSILAVSVQFYATPEIISYVPRSAFWPQPKVDSAILRVTPILADSKTDLRGFFKIVRTGFSNPRKQLVNNLSIGLKLNRETVTALLESAGIDPKRRAETLSVDGWIKLNEKFKIKNEKLQSKI